MLSFYDCDALLRTALECMNDETPAVRVFAYEASFMASMLERNRSNISALLGTLNQLPAENPGSPEMQALFDRIKAHPEELHTAITSAESIVKQTFAIAVENVNLPADKRKPYLHGQSNRLEDMLSNAFTIDLSTVVDRYTVSRTKLYLLALHALIHKYKWEHGVYPGGLAELHRPELTTDLMTGKAFTYTLKDDIYTLSAVGLSKKGANGEALPQRDSITLP